MSLFQSILADIQKKILKETGDTEAIAAVVSSVLSITISPSMIKVKNQQLFINAPATIKLALSLKKGLILQALQKQGIKIVSIS